MAGVEGAWTTRVASRASSLAAIALLLFSAWRRPDVAIGMVVLALVFIPLERRWPVVEAPVLRRGWSVDVVHFVVDQVLSGALVALAAIVLVPSIEPLVPDLDVHLHGPALWITAAAIGEVIGYWGHRAMHRVPWLWRIHAVHHSSPTMDWLAPNRRHVLDTAFGQAVAMVPLLALGLSPPMVVGAFVIRRAQGLFVHANLKVHVPGLRWVLATPEFHHWHHSADPDRYDTNFAGQCPIVDRIFGTLYMPARQWPSSYGIADGLDPVPADYVARLTWPFQGLAAALRRRARRVVAAATVATLAASAAVAVITATPAAAIPWASTCTVQPKVERYGSPMQLTIDATGIVVSTDGDRPDKVHIQRITGTPETGISFRVIRHSGAPLTVRIAPSWAGARRVRAEVIGPEGRSDGTCRPLHVHDGAS